MKIFYLDLPFRSVLKRCFDEINKRNVMLISVLCLFSLVAMLSISPAIGTRIGVGKFHFAKKQAIFIALAIFIMIMIAMVSSDLILWSSVYLAGVLMLLMIVVLIFGNEVKGAKRWINIGFFSLQPSEILKPFFAVTNAFFLSGVNIGTIKKACKSAIFFIIVAFLLLRQPDVGMFITYLICWITQLFIANVPIAIFGFLFVAIAISAVSAYFIFSHVKYRVDTFFTGDSELHYQVKKALQSIGEGGKLGKGPGEGVVKFDLPDSHTDYIFAAISEEWGYIVCASLIAIYAYIIIMNMFYFSFEEDNLKQSAGFGILMIFASQVLINIAVSLNFLPSKGMVLPFISYGGSAMLGMAISFGIILAFTKKEYGYTSRYQKISSTFKAN